MDGRKCFGCGNVGHLRKDCPQKQTKSPNIKCFACGKHGHFRKDCTSFVTGSDVTKSASASASGATQYFPECTKKFIDTHCHLEYIFERLRHSGSFSDFKTRYPFPESFEGCITTFCDPAAFSTFGTWQELILEDGVWGAFGCHPHNADYYNETLETKIIQCLENPKAIALGETGLDYSLRSKAAPEKQKEVFVKQAKWAAELGKPLVIHCREAEADTFQILQANVPSDWKIHMHCYTGSVEFAQKFLKQFNNLYIGITGLVTFAKAKEIHELAFDVPLDRLVLETDSPYFVPAQIAGSNKWCNPGMAVYVAERIAEIKNISLDDVLEAARKNTSQIYGI